MAEISTNKRRRKEGLHLSDLTDYAVAHVASYLSNTSRAIFAIASPSASKLTILSSDEKLWETLDFGDIDYSNRLSRKLKDGGLRDILTIVDAINNTKCIKLTGCINIDGSGLSPLSGSIVLKQLDLGLVGQNESPELDPEPLISEECVVPILTSIINAEGNSMTHLQLPKKWRNNEESTLLANFLTRYNDVLARNRSKCINCRELITITSTGGHVISTGIFFGQQNSVCCKCLKLYCGECETEDERGAWIRYCNNCEKDYCVDCISCDSCDACYDTFCSGCKVFETCDDCLEAFCQNCAEKKCACCVGSSSSNVCASCAGVLQCKWEGCEEVFCRNCEKEHLLSHSRY